MPRVKLVLEYDGSNYVGWQLQQNGPSIQGRLQRALQELLEAPVAVTAAGRTDAGVHATGQVVAFDSPRQLPTRAYWMGLNGLLPDDIAVVSAEEVDAAFDPRRWARGKRYRYRIGNRRSRSPLRRTSHWEIFQPLNLAAMQESVHVLLGTHDFSGFRAADCQAMHPVRKITKVELSGVSGDELALVIEGTAFLKHMVRNIVGSVAEVGRGKQPPSYIADILRHGERTRAGQTAPPQGLTLEAVFYGDGPREDADDGE
ncbi:MAG: tRNA pseudouridine(38-40) synthase TruA [Myxococcaceae bacterium]|jgi:tRNA pseudouridine38-40 synthase|nr:tRNA pseudouridine(38-40) synthase TruA [Myxococcaceae bacterium]